MIAEAVMKLVRAFADDGHSGGSMQMTLAAFDRVVRFKCLTDLTDNPDEWMNVSHMGANGDPAMWQSLRMCSCFSTDGGKTYYDIDAGDERAIKTSLAMQEGE
jgi:hypothetical protein